MNDAELKGPVNPEFIFNRIRQYAEFARSVLHLDFPDLEVVNPSFAVLSKYFDLLATILREQKDNSVKEQSQKAGRLAEIMSDIAEAIVDRDDQSLIDCMGIIDQFLNDTRKK